MCTWQYHLLVVFISNNAELQTGYDKKWLETKAVAQLLIQLLIDEANYVSKKEKIMRSTWMVV